MSCISKAVSINSDPFPPLVWREFKGAPRVCLRLNLLMFGLFVLGIVMIILAGR